MPSETAKRRGMVRWYSPSQLVNTAGRVVASAIFAEYADSRLIEALADKERPSPFDLSDGLRDGTFWIDFAADTGDGWDPAYAIASTMARSELDMLTTNGRERLSRAQLLILGGDQVYPTPTRERYKERLENVYDAAFAGVANPPMVAALPGNHDWYDNLAAFSRLFVAQRRFGPFQTFQRRSYFAVKLPKGWWLVGADFQLGADVDAPQVEYFKCIVNEMQPDDRIILCVPEPSWSTSAVYPKQPGSSDHNRQFISQLFGDRVCVYLSGDLHHYRRHTHPTSGVHMFTAGGGGAHLHPTHRPDVETLADGSVRGHSFPPPATTWKYCFLNVFFLWFNPTFGLIPAIIYTFFVWILLGTGTHTPEPVGALELLARVPSNGVAALLCALVLVAFFVFTDTHSRMYRIFAGLTHGILHLAAASWIGALAFQLVNAIGLNGNLLRLTALSLVFTGGWAVGSTLMGIYLLVSLNVFGRHGYHAFSSLRIKGWKSFLRLRVDEDGRLTIFPIGLEQVPSTRKLPLRPPSAATDEEPGLVAGMAINPTLIEDPIVVCPAASTRVRTRRASPTQEQRNKWYFGMKGRVGM